MDIGILALQGDVAEHRRALADLGVGSRPVRRPADLPGLDGIVLPGGESTTMSMLLQSSELLEPLGKEIGAGLPVFGTCAGMILLGTSVTGGRGDQICYGAMDITVRRNGYGRQLASFECDLDVPALGDEPLHAVFIRAPSSRRPVTPWRSWPRCRRRPSPRPAPVVVSPKWTCPHRCCAGRALCWWPLSIPSSPPIGGCTGCSYR